MFQENESHDTNSIVGDPLFKNSVGNDYTVYSDSPVINNGTNVDCGSDYYNNPVSNTPDIGIYEYQSNLDDNKLTPPTLYVIPN
jgi:hypothetical protein